MSTDSGYLEPSLQPIAPELPSTRVPGENPPWNGWDVFKLALMMFVVPFLVIPVVALAIQKIFYPGTPFMDVAKKPWVPLSTQFAWYALIAVYMVIFVEGTYRQRFWDAIRWNWPKRHWFAFIPLGMMLVSLQVLERFFKMPKHIPMEDFLSTPTAAILTGILAVSAGPFMEELFFRGFFYPVLARRFGMIAGVLVTSVCFGLVHGVQLNFSIGLVLVVTLVGLVLTVVRAKTKSVASSFITHVAYNSTLVALGARALHHAGK
jgi:membrane protease YdiL (CAAX protease family)